MQIVLLITFLFFLGFQELPLQSCKSSIGLWARTSSLNFSRLTHPGLPFIMPL